MYILSKKLKESFQQGTATRVLQKLARIVSRRIGKPVSFASFPIKYTNADGIFLGFYGAVTGSKDRLRLNFKLSSSDEIYSLDIFKGVKLLPIVTVELAGFNIIQIVEILAEEITGQIDVIEESLQERTMQDRKEMLFSSWVNETPEAIDLLQNKKLANVYTLFLRGSEFNSELNFASFTQLAKNFLYGRGLTNPTFRKRRKGSSEREIVDQSKQDQLQDLVEAMSWENKFEFLESSVHALAQNKIQGVIVYGSPGSGKSETVYNTLDSLNVDYKKFSGGFKTADEVFKLLTKYRDNTIIVFDDADSVWKNLDLANIFKAALQNKPVREITWREKVLTFSSGVIFISNLTKFNSAIMSRSMTIEINLSNEQMLQKIEKTLDGFHPEVDLIVKKEALAFLKEWQSGVKTVDYRELEKIIIAIQIQPRNWKNFALLMLSSQ